MNRLELEGCYHRGRELARRILLYYNLQNQEHKERVRYSRYPTVYPFRAAVVAVLQDEALDEVTMERVLKELGRIGNIELAEAALEWLTDRPPGAPPPTKRLFDALLSVCCASFQATRALGLLTQMETTPGCAPPDVRSCNMAIASCAHSGRLDDALAVLDSMTSSGTRPNSFTAAMLLQACAFKGRGRYLEALRAYRLMEDVCPAAVTEEVTDALLSVCTSAMHKAESLADAEAVFSALEDLQLADCTVVYNALLRAAAKAGNHQAARRVFEQLEAAGVWADAKTYSLVIQASVAGGALDQALEVFEWMLAGRASERPTASDIGTYNHLIRACHQAGRLEKALEITAWVHSTHVEFDQQTYEELIGTVEVAQLWDNKAIRAAIGPPGGLNGSESPTFGGRLSHGSKSLAVFPAHLRPAPYDGLRILYLDRAAEHEEEEVLAREKLGARTSWVAATMLKGYPPSHFLPGGVSPAGHIMAVPNRKNASPVALSVQPTMNHLHKERVHQYSSLALTPDVSSPLPSHGPSHPQHGAHTLPPLFRDRGPSSMGGEGASPLAGRGVARLSDATWPAGTESTTPSGAARGAPPPWAGDQPALLVA